MTPKCKKPCVMRKLQKHHHHLWLLLDVFEQVSRVSRGATCRSARSKKEPEATAAPRLFSHRPQNRQTALLWPSHSTPPPLPPTSSSCSENNTPPHTTHTHLFVLIPTALLYFSVVSLMSFSTVGCIFNEFIYLSPLWGRLQQSAHWKSDLKTFLFTAAFLWIKLPLNL